MTWHGRRCDAAMRALHAADASVSRAQRLTREVAAFVAAQPGGSVHGGVGALLEEHATT